MTMIDKAEALLPCPFCGKVPEPPVDATRILGVWRVVHKGCTTMPNFAVERSEKSEAIAAWNRRAALEPAPTDAAQAREAEEEYEAVDAGECMPAVDVSPLTNAAAVAMKAREAALREAADVCLDFIVHKPKTPDDAAVDARTAQDIRDAILALIGEARG